MAPAVFLRLSLWAAALLGAGLGCPEVCTCSDKYSRHFAECSYKDLAEVPPGLPPNVTTLSLSANRISLLPVGSFDNVTRVTSLWMAHNRLVSVEPGTLAPLVHLRNFDISHNKIVDFPWEDLQNLTDLQLLKMNHNEMVLLPRDAFYNLNDLRSLRLNNNKFLTIAEGTFDGLMSLSHLQIYSNPFTCTCFLDWLRVWISSTTVTVPDQNLIACAAPEELKGEAIGKLPESKCSSPNVTIRLEPSIRNATFQEDGALVLTCEFKGNPEPQVVWNIPGKHQRRELLLAEHDSAESDEDSMRSPAKVYNNGTLVISHLRREDAGIYSCSAANELGKAEDSLTVEVVAAPPEPAPTREAADGTPAHTQTHPSKLQTTEKTPALDSVRLADPMRKDNRGIVAAPPTTESNSGSAEEATQNLLRASKCGPTANTRYVSSHVFNGSAEDVKQYTFDFGVIALGVSETEATVRLNPLLIPRDTSADPTAAVASASAGSHNVSGEGLRGAHSNGLYLCITADRKHSAVQWSQIKEGVKTYLFSGLRPGTNYSLCLTYRGRDCEVQVLFTTRRRVPNLLIIISVSICLLTVSTVPLLGATCFHLVYKYRGKTYKLILRAKDQYHMERNLAASFKMPHTESQRRINGSQLNEEEGDVESVDGDKEADTEESVVTESFTLSQYRGNLDDYEVGSELSDPLPLGAEAVNITTD